MPRTVHKFSITISQFDGSKQDVKQFMETNFGESIEQYCIAKRKTEGCENDILVYLKTKAECEVSTDTISADMEVFADKECDVQTCKSSKTCLKQITKEDNDPILKSVCVDGLALYARIHHTARHEEPRWDHPFMMEHMKHGQTIMKMWKEARATHLGSAKVHPFVYTPDCEWQQTAIDVINEYIMNPRFKQPHLYLWGPPNAGKTTFVQDIIGINEWKPALPVNYVSQFWLGSVTDQHHVILMDDFRKDDYKLSDLLQLLQGGWMTVQKKYEDPHEFQWRKPIIITANEPYETLPEVLKVRLTGVHARRYVCHLAQPLLDASCSEHNSSSDAK